MKNKKLYNTVNKKLENSQASILLIEEISELITEISLIMANEGSIDHLTEEIIDVEIMTNLVMRTFKIENKDVNKYMDKIRKKEDVETNLMRMSFNKDELFKKCIKRLSVFQKTICKKNRGRHNKKDIAEAIASVNISLEVLIEICDVSDNRYEKWKSKKLKRLQKRSKKNKII